MSYHEITIIGRLGRDPEMRYTPGGVAVTSFPLAANHRHRNCTGRAGQRDALVPGHGLGAQCRERQPVSCRRAARLWSRGA